MEEIVPVHLQDNNGVGKKLLPLMLTFIIIAADQLTKYLIVHMIPPYTVGTQFFGDFIRIIHVHNPGVAFSIGVGLPHPVRRLVFAFLPLIVLICIMVLYFKSKDFTRLQRWAVCGVVGGGSGNLIDRFFRTEGVIDFIDVKFFGILGYERWPTFNIADMAVVVCGILLLISFIIAGKADAKTAEEIEQGSKND
ncbi:signal peptidase II [Treponema sp. OMZ 840]|uniref:signal peptidase II n=1 Tax=Treponema sp. OMZ 840 TaxID=244313 RepID=UPI003D92AEAD